MKKRRTTFLLTLSYPLSLACLISATFSIGVGATDIDCIEKYAKAIESKSASSGRATLDSVIDMKRVRALIRESYKMIPTISNEEAVSASEAGDDSAGASSGAAEGERSTHQTKKDREREESQRILAIIARDAHQDVTEVAQVLRDATQYAGNILCTAEKLPTLKEIAANIQNGYYQHEIEQDQDYQIVKGWRDEFRSYNGKFLMGIEIEVEPRGLVNAAALKWVDFNKIYREWRKFDATKISPPSDPLKRAQELVAFAKLLHDGNAIRGMKTIPFITINQPLFLQNMNMFWDDGAIEFNHQTPYQNAADMLESVYRIAKATRFEQEVFAPTFQYGKTISRTNYHLSSQIDKKIPENHPEEFSMPINARKQDIRAVSYELNKLLALKMVARGYDSPFDMNYKHDISRYRAGYQNLKGITRISPRKEFNRVEIRRHYVGLVQELKDYMNYYLMDENAAIALVQEEIRHYLADVNILEHIFEREPLNLINYRHLLPPAVMQEYIDRMPQSDKEFAVRLLEIDQSRELKQVAEILASTPIINQNPWYTNDPIKVCDPVDAIVERYGKKYVQGYHIRRINPENFTSECFMPSFDRLREVVLRTNSQGVAIQHTPSDSRYIAP
ncbi:MAG: hypothetical protein HQK53_06650 [Oligoflexia bacterium]|nr:hypothetical protein [Oligoflexia bacterium]